MVKRKSLWLSVLSSFFLMGCSPFVKPSISTVVPQNVSATAASTIEQIQGFNNLSILKCYWWVLFVSGYGFTRIDKGIYGLAWGHWRSFHDHSQLFNSVICRMDIYSCGCHHGGYQFSLGMAYHCPNN